VLYSRQGNFNTHYLGGSDDLPVLQHHARCASALDQDAVHVRPQSHLAAVLLHAPAAAQGSRVCLVSW